MNIFDKLSMVAQYDELCRVVNKLIEDSAAEEDASLAMLENLKHRWYNREETHEREKNVLKGEIGKLQKEIKKLGRQLAESRTALVRESEEKKLVARERKALLEQIRQVRKLVESENGLSNTDAHRNRVIKCLDVDRLTPIQSDDSDDCVSGLDYDRTEEDILADGERSRSSNGFDEMLQNLNANEQPTLLYRYLDKNSGNSDEQPEQEEPTRASRRAAEAALKRLSNQRSSRERSSSRGKKLAAEVAMESDDNYIIESVKKELNRIDAENKERLAATNSTPNVRMPNRAATLSARSTANLIKNNSNASTPVPTTQKEHSFVSKKLFKPSNCRPCGKKIAFFENVYKCENCQVTSHPECRDNCPLPCVRITAPTTRSRSKKILISDYVNKDAIPKVPALIVHCCNEIERGENILTEGLYRVVSSTSEIEDLQQRILKSKSGMPNLSKMDVHLLTGVVKRFLMSLDESLITTTLWSHFAEAVSSESSSDARNHMQYYISYDLPSANRDTLAYLMQHLHAIAKHSDRNLMTSTNLSKTLAPTIIGNSCCNPPKQTIQTENKIQIKIMETLFEIEEDYWNRFVQRSSTPVTTSLGSRLLGGTPSSSVGPRTRASARLGGTLPTPKVKPLFS